MSIYGIRGPLTGTPTGPGAAGTSAPGGAATRTTQRTGVQPAPAKAPASGAERTAPTATAAVPVQPPPGTDPELWSVLSGEERAYFAKLGAMGPLTYGRVMSGQVQPQQAVSRGARLDVRA